MLIDLLHRQVRRRYHRLGFKDGFIPSNRFSIHFYERRGSSGTNTLFLIHGLGTSSSTWVRTLPSLGPEWNVLAIDLPGFGFSKINSGPPFATLPEHDAAISSLVNEKLEGSFILLGHSLGGWLAGRFALRQPRRVKHLILVDSAGVLCDDTYDQGKAFMVQSRRDLKKLLDKLWLSYPWYFRPFYPAVLHDLRQRHVADFVRSIQERDFLNEDLPKLSPHLTVIWGRQDRLISIGSIDIIRNAVPGLEAHVIEQCGHVPQLENPTAFVSLLQKILEEEALAARLPLVI